MCIYYFYFKIFTINSDILCVNMSLSITIAKYSEINSIMKSQPNIQCACFMIDKD